MRMTDEEMRKVYPNQWLVLTDVIWKEKEEPVCNVESAEVYKAGLNMKDALLLAHKNNMITFKTTYETGEY